VPRVAARGSRVMVVWQEAAPGALPTIRAAVSRDGGATFGAPVGVSGAPAGSVAETNPAIAMRGRQVAVVWQELASGRDDDRGRIRLAFLDARGRRRSAPLTVSDRADVGTWVPAVAFAGPRPIVAWIDERDLGSEGEPFEHVYAARLAPDGRSFLPAVRVDQGVPVDAATHHDNKWAPAIAAARRSAWIAWGDFRSYNWDIYLARSDDHGASWGANVRVDDYAAVERINERPALAVDRDGTLHAAWTDLRARQPDTNIRYTRSRDAGASFSASHQIDGSDAGADPDRDTPAGQWRPALAVDAGHVFVAWQDDRLGNDDVFFTLSTDGGGSFAPAERVDDSGSGTSLQTRPSLAVAGHGARRRCVVAWEDDRDGVRDVRVARRACGR